MSQPQVNATAGTVLGFLSRGPMSGWDLTQAIDGSVGNFWNVTRSQVYRELKALEEQGFVTQAGATGPRERRVYKLTPAGRREFKRWVARDLGEETRRVPVLLTTFFGAAVPPKRFAEILTAHRDELEERLAHLRALDKALADQPPARATVRYGIAYCRMAIRWINDEALPMVG
ncbi:MAG: PadR family transcriptional regulator [Acidimicrobiales bacterium]